MTKKEWKARVKALLKAELNRRDLTYADLAAAIGVKDTERNISNKLGRGSFAAFFFLQCLSAIGCHAIDIDER